jgi:hypothetical protein
MMKGISSLNFYFRRWSINDNQLSGNYLSLLKMNTIFDLRNKRGTNHLK